MLELKMHSKNKEHIEASIILNGEYIGWIERYNKKYDIFIDGTYIKSFDEWVECFSYLKNNLS